MQAVLEQKSASTRCEPALSSAACAEFRSSGHCDRHLRRIRRVFVDMLVPIAGNLPEMHEGEPSRWRVCSLARTAHVA